VVIGRDRRAKVLLEFVRLDDVPTRADRVNEVRQDDSELPPGERRSDAGGERPAAACRF
jgi:hypothetical protein